MKSKISDSELSLSAR